MKSLNDRKLAADHYLAYQWNYLAAAILGGFHGEVMVDDVDWPHVSILHLPPVSLYMLGGDPSHLSALEAVKSIPNRSMVLFGDQTEAWMALTKKVHGINVIELERYAFTSENLNLEHLRSLRDGLPAEFTLKKIDRTIAGQIAAEKSPLTEDHIRTFSSVDDFLEKGFGFVVLDGEKIVSIASTFVVCEAGIEIQINTRKEYEGRGLGTAVGAALIVYSMENGIDPNWDAATKTSAHLAKKFGYTEQGEYPMLFIFGPKLLTALVLALRWFVRLFRKKA